MIVVISPPGGLGEITAVSAGKLGASVKWFVVSPSGSQASAEVPLSTSSLEEVEMVSGSIELAGSDSASLVISKDEAGSAIPAVGAWCNSLGTIDCIVCTLDGIESAILSSDLVIMTKEEIEAERGRLLDAVKIATREASSSAGLVKKLALIPANAEEMKKSADDDDDENGEGFGGIVGSFFGSKSEPVPKGLRDALGREGVNVLRHGELLGLADSAPNASPFLGGPRRDPVFREEYLTRSVRVDPSISSSGALMVGRDTRTSRLALGEAAALIACGRISSLTSAPTKGFDLCLTSLPGIESPATEEWSAEFDRALVASQSTKLLQVPFSSVPDISRLADWLVTKWAPAALRAYEIARIRVGARPVYGKKVDDNSVEIVWQELVKFETVITGRMIIALTKTSLEATRGPGDGEFDGLISPKPLPGESVLVRSLADAASQAVEKGLAVKPKTAKKVKQSVPAKKPKEKVSTTFVSDSDSAATTTAPPPPPPPPPTTTGTDTGPRAAGARRSVQRSRGKRKKMDSSSSSESGGSTEKSTSNNDGKSFE